MEYTEFKKAPKKKEKCVGLKNCCMNFFKKITRDKILVMTFTQSIICNCIFGNNNPPKKFSMEKPNF